MMPHSEHFFQALTDFLSEKLATAVTIAEATPLAGGASRDTWHLTVTANQQSHEFVLRRDLPSEIIEGALSREEEFAVMERAYQAGVKVAQVRFLEASGTLLGTPFFIMDYLRGISIGRKVITEPNLAHARQLLPDQMAQELARLLEFHGFTTS